MSDVKDLEHLPLMKVVVLYTRKHEELRGKLELVQMLAKAMDRATPDQIRQAEGLLSVLDEVPKMERSLLELGSVLHWLQKVRP